MPKVCKNGILFAVVVSLSLFSMANAQEEAKEAAGPAVSMMTLKLKEGLELKGTPMGMEKVQINSLFGEASIPVHTVAGIRFAQSPNEQTTLVLLNGDALTGDIAVGDIEFAADWGTAKVNVNHLVSVTFQKGLTWTSVPTPNGTRWQLRKATATATPVVNGRVYQAR